MDFAGVLDRQHVPAGDRGAGLIAPALDQPFDRHLFVGREMTVPDLGGTAAGGQSSQAQGLARDDRIGAAPPPFIAAKIAKNWPKDEVGARG